MHFDAEFFVALGFLLFVILLGYLGVHDRILTELDRRAERVSQELAEAKRLREEAERVLQSFQEKAKQAEIEAANIVTRAKTEAETLAREAAERMQDFITRRSEQADAKIALAETQAAAEVRSAAADAAVAAAERVLKETVRGPAAASYIAEAISDTRRRLQRTAAG
jgi:F-type H+-transporting ATPase subunit b